jgi:phosphohistidine phosphatase
MAQEIELKLRCEKSDLPALRRALDALGGEKARAITLANTYYDTPDLALHDKRIALRLRRAGRRMWQTVKTAGVSEAGLSRRNEWEAPFAGQFDFSAVEDSALRAFLDAQASSLQALFTTNFKRTAWRIEFAGATIEVAVDVGSIEVGAYHEPIFELELELLAGPENALKALHQALAQSATLVPENASKAARGFALYRQAVIVTSSGKRTLGARHSDKASMDLLLWRHAEAEDGSPDEARALTARGKKQAQAMAQWLLDHEPKKLRVITSPARRAVQTASAFTDDFEIDRRIAPGCSVADILAATGWPHVSGAVLVVGHQPTLGRLAALLLGGEEADWSIKKGAVWWFSYRVREGEAQVVLRAVLGPEMVG